VAVVVVVVRAVRAAGQAVVVLAFNTKTPTARIAARPNPFRLALVVSAGPARFCSRSATFAKPKTARMGKRRRLALVAVLNLCATVAREEARETSPAAAALVGQVPSETSARVAAAAPGRTTPATETEAVLPPEGAPLEAVVVARAEQATVDLAVMVIAEPPALAEPRPVAVALPVTETLRLQPEPTRRSRPPGHRAVVVLEAARAHLAKVLRPAAAGLGTAALMTTGSGPAVAVVAAAVALAPVMPTPVAATVAPDGRELC
jgi:hypothetical protein